MIKKLTNPFNQLLVLGMIVTLVFLCCNLSTTRVLSSSSNYNSLLGINLDQDIVISDDFNDGDYNGWTVDESTWTDNDEDFGRSTSTLSLDSFQYEIHDSISIDDDSGFSEQGFPGSGTSDDPYLISGYSISSPTSHVIEIVDIDSYFIIRDNILNGGGPNWGNGIAFINTSHGTIENNLISESSTGIYLHNSDNTLILNNSFTRNVFGVGIETGSDNTLVKWNNFIIPDGNYGAYDGGSNNTFMYNHWDDWTSPDTNNDGIVDNPYPHIGPSETQDNFPLVYPTISFYFDHYDFLEAWDTGHGQDVVIDGSGNVYKTNQGSGVDIYDSNGNFIETWTGGGKLGPTCGLIFDSQWNLYIVDEGFRQVVKLDSQGNFVMAWGSEGEGEGQFLMANRIACDSQDNIYVADNGLSPSRIQKFDSNGNFIRSWNLPINAGDGMIGLAIDSRDYVYVAADYFLKYDDDGNLIKEWGTPLTGDGRLSGTHGLAVDRFDALYVTELDTPRVQKFHPDSVFITEFGSDSGQGQLNWPLGITIASNGLVYVIEGWSELDDSPKIKIFTPYKSYSHSIAEPTVISPNGGETLDGTVGIQWTPAIDSFSHGITFSVYYSTDGGTSWKLLASDLTTTSYQWDTTTEISSFNYLVKVVATCADGLTMEDVSDAVFTIQNSIPSFNIFQLLIPVIIFISFLFVIFVIFSGPIRSKWVTSSSSEDKTRLYSRTVPSTTKEAAIPKEVPVKEPRLSKDVVSRESVEPSLQAKYRAPDTSQDISIKDRLLCVSCGAKLLKIGDQFCVYCGKKQPGV
ncbi:MAG: right-handed parallel beta-helix repeat-containing protein [Candidatus Hodarchaeales archaeon]